MQICQDFMWIKQPNLHKNRKSCINYKFIVHLEKYTWELERWPQWLRPLIDLLKDPGSNPGIPMAVHTYLSLTPVSNDLMLYSGLYGHKAEFLPGQLL